MVPVDKVKPNPKNPNKHPESQVQLLAKVIKRQGWRAPVTISKLSGFIVRGHGRFMAARLLGVSEVPVDYQDYKTVKEEYADLLADNKIAESAEFDFALASDLLREMDVDEREVSGFFEHELETLLAGEWSPPEKEEMPDGSGSDMVKFIATREQATVIRGAIDSVVKNEKTTISDGRALELICANFLA